MGRRVSLNDTGDYLKEDDDIVSTESYERCLKGIRGLEDCIRRVDRHNDLLREKYGVDCESASARLSLASPSTDPRAPVTDDSSIPRRTDIPFVKTERFTDSRAESRLADDDLKKRIFDQLMNVANSARYRNSGKLQSRFSRRPDFESPNTYSKLRERYSKEPFSKDVRGNLNLDEADSKDDQDFTRYEITGNLSVARSSPSQDLDDDLDWTLEDEFLPLKRADLVSGSVDTTNTDRRFSPAPSRTMDRDSPTLSRRDTIDSGIVDDETPGRSSSGTNLTVHRVLTDDARERLQELDDYSRKIRDSGSKVDIGFSNEVVHCRDKLKYPGSPRARFLELLRERRRIVESSRGTSAL